MRRCIRLLAVVAVLPGATATSAYATALWDIIDNTAGKTLTFHFSNYDMGSAYDPSLLGSATQDSWNTTDDPGVFAGHARLNPVAEALGVAWDSWGIAHLDGVSTGGTSLWTAGSGGTEVFAMFWGAVDQSLSITDLGSGQYGYSIAATGMQFAAWEFDGGSPDWDSLPAAGAGNGTSTGLYFVGGDVTKPGYYGLTDVAGATNIFSGSSIPKPLGDEFAVRYALDYGDSRHIYGWNTDSANSGFWADDPGAGNGWNSPAYNPYLGRLSTTLNTAKFSFHTSLFNAGYDPDSGYQYVDDRTWDEYSNDPILATVTPELSSSTLMLLGMLPIGLGWWRRRKA